MEGLSKTGLSFNNTVITLFQSVPENIARGLMGDGDRISYHKS